MGIAKIDILRVHVLGRELPVLRSATPLLMTGAVSSAAVALFGPHVAEARARQDTGAIRALLEDHGFRLSRFWSRLPRVSSSGRAGGENAEDQKHTGDELQELPLD